MMPSDIIFDRAFEYDIVVTTCGYEERSSYLCRLGIKGTQRVAIYYPNTSGGSYERNLKLYEDRNWRIESFKTCAIVLEGLLADGAAATLAIDISSMPRTTLAFFVEWLTTTIRKPLEVHFIYCPGTFDESSRAANIVAPMTAEPVSKFFTGALRAPSIPIGLIVGLGLEPHRAAGVIELLEPARTWLFAASSGDERFKEAAERVNEPLLKLTNQSGMFEYDIRSLADTYSALESLCFSAGLDYRLIMAPSGPKMFSLACLLVAANGDTARPAVWRVGNAVGRRVFDVHEAGDVSASRVMFGEVDELPRLRDARPVSSPHGRFRG